MSGIFDSTSSLRECGLSSKRILVVDDNELNREVAGELVALTGAQVFFAEDGRQAVELVEQKGEGFFHLIIMDINMPEMNGYEATKAIRELGTEYAKKLPVVALTSDTFAADVVHSREAGMNEHLEKPIDINRLAAVLKKWLG